MSKHGANLPAVLNPVGDTCVQVFIPNHPDYIKLFLRAIRMLEVQRNYARDETMQGAKIVTEQWRDRTITPLIEALANSTGSCGVDGECLAYPPFASFISYSPQNPYTEPDLIPDGFEQPPFFVNGKDAAHDLPNYNKGDVILDFGSINIEPSWDLAKTPRIELCLEGSGVAEIHFLNIVQGGVAIISLDNPVDLGDIIAGIIGDGIDSIDLNQDIVSLPPETVEEIIIEIEVPTEGEHIIYIYFLPVVNDSLIPLSFGGGLREISLCGNLRPCGTPPEPPPPPLEGVTELKPQFQFTPDCGLEYRLLNQDDEIVQDWTAVEGWTENAALCFAVGGGEVATKEDIRDGIIEAALSLSLRMASGSDSDLCFDEEGNPIPPSEGGDAPEDDPVTPIDESLTALAGGAIAVRLGFNEIWTAVSTMWAGGKTVAQAEVRLTDLYQWEDPAYLLDFLNDYWAARTGALSFVAAFTTVLDGYLFCKGNTKQVISDWCYDTYTNQDQLDMSLYLKRAIAQAQMDLWFAYGTKTPTTAYLEYSCSKIPTESFILNMALSNAPQYTTNGVWKQGHRYRIDITGSYSDSDVADLVGDGMYFYVPSTGAKTYSPLNFNFGGAVSAPVQAQVPYSASHIYSFTVEKNAGSGNAAGIITRDNGVMAIPNVTGTLNFTITDLGEFAL